MATAYKVLINKPMLEGLRKLLRSKVCPLCHERLELHSSVTLTKDARVADCSNYVE